PQFKMWIHGNHKPGLKSVDKALRRRIRLIPFAVTIPEDERDRKLGEKLRSEWPGILAWAIEGCLIWQREGLVPPRAVTEATEVYLANEDAVARWLEDRCVSDVDAWTSSVVKFASWTSLSEDNGERVGSA